MHAEHAASVATCNVGCNMHHQLQQAKIQPGSAVAEAKLDVGCLVVAINGDDVRPEHAAAALIETKACE